VVKNDNINIVKDFLVNVLVKKISNQLDFVDFRQIIL